LTYMERRLSFALEGSAMPMELTAFAQAWIAAWNARDLDAILSHYASDVVFLSPYAECVIGTGRVVGIEALRSYWRRGPDANPSCTSNWMRSWWGTTR
jgi:hypothetical protein